MDDGTTEQPPLPPRVALLWGRQQDRRRGPRATLTAAEITRAAIAVADAEGLSAVSMARVAAELGNSTMALYRHVRSKDELLVLMADAAIDAPPDAAQTGDWPDDLRRWALDSLAATRRHPWFVQLPVGTPPLGPRNLAWFDRALAALEPTGLPADERVGIVTTVLIYVQGMLRLGTDLAAGYESDPDVFGAQYGRVLGVVVDPHRMPALARAVAAGVFDGPPGGVPAADDATAGPEFELGLSFLIDGIAAHVARRAG